VHEAPAVPGDDPPAKDTDQTKAVQPATSEPAASTPIEASAPDRPQANSDSAPPIPIAAITITIVAMAALAALAIFVYVKSR